MTEPTPSEAVDDIGRAALEGVGREPKPSRVHAPYGRQNLVVLAVQVVAWAALLTAIDRVDSVAPQLGWWAKAPLVLLFCFVMQGVFTMMHEFFHGIAHPNKRVAYAIGVVGSTLFGTAATLHQVQHWGHHVRNRTPAEQGEFYHPHESRLGKTALYYFAVGGGLYLSGLVFPFLALLLPYRSVEKLAAKKERNTYSAAFEQFEARHWRRMRYEAVGLALFWTAVTLWGPWRWQTLLLAYGCFAFTWSSLQWVYHLRTPLDVVEGAYNLRLPTPLRWLLLNFNCNLTHHRQPHLPWQELYAHSDPRETQPLWYRWALVALPPEPYPTDDAGFAKLDKRYF